MNTKHTSGPWTRGFQDNQTIYAGSKRIASVQCDRTQWEANARLIASAPDMLAALESMVSEIKQHNAAQDRLGACIIWPSSVDAAIAKAKGATAA